MNQFNKIAYYALQTILTDVPYPVAVFDDNRKLLVCNELFDSLSQKNNIAAFIDSLFVFHNDSIRSSNVYEYSLDSFYVRIRALYDFCVNNNSESRLSENDQQRERSQTKIGFVLSLFPQKNATDYNDWIKWKKLKLLASSDPLTGLANRYALEQALASFEPSHPNECGTFVLCDIDHFKEINDQLGHDIGDQLLVQFAQILKTMFRSQDVVARIGGDEFAVFCPYCKLDVAQKRMNTFPCQVTLNRSPNEKLNISLALSFGIIELKTKQSLSEAIRQADPLLYKMKRNVKQ
ncbi:MAG: GGDEF domain-containing protein [Planctomycetia bacterium]|nr:GGDEF domain-containing protein [Planctomycetia bacterium]